MSEKSRGEMILETIKVMIWPLLIVIGVIWLGGDFKDMLKSRTFKIGGVLEVGERVTVLQGTLQDELLSQKDSLHKILAHSNDPAKVHDFATEALNRIEKAQAGVKKDIQEIKQTIPQALPAESGKSLEQPGRQDSNAGTPRTAKDWEIQGFKHLVSRNVTSSIQAFSEAEKIWPDYHNVAEIRQLLVRKKEALESKESPAWKEVCRKILNDYSWGMPSDVRQEIQRYVSQ
ncbi:MAG: hypothetical protein A4E66_00649 [Syntrophus sp. PtaB.Bin001]|nr:MAG: hypothetical protein A4E66_00649 [Syntrophus sp. PtaB.Bin001]